MKDVRSNVPIVSVCVSALVNSNRSCAFRYKQRCRGTKLSVNGTHSLEGECMLYKIILYST